MKEATIIYPHQLSFKNTALAKERPVYVVEESLILTHNPIHRQKLVFHKLSLDAFEAQLQSNGYRVTRISIFDCETTESVFEKIKRDGVELMHIADTTDYLLEKAIKVSGLARTWYDSPLFILPKAEAIERFIDSKRFMASFYKNLRKDKDILMDGEKPRGGKWSFDEDNRKKIPKGTTLPEDITLCSNDLIAAAIKWEEKVTTEKYGESGCWLPYTEEEAEKFLQEFFRLRFENFGSYEDAMSTESVRLWHSAISPLLNVGLLTPTLVLEEALAYAENNDVPLNSLEGFVRQILGWREFIRASYESDGGKMRNQNFFCHQRSLPDTFWNGTTTIVPVDHTIKTALHYGYTHHIERLMVMGNFMLLNQIHPDHIYRWFMAMYLDAYDWVMVPNVYGMSQFADGGSFATKPYISGSNYIKKMSDFPSGDWEDIWTALYWNFIEEHVTFFSSNHRLSMMPRMLEKMSAEKRVGYKKLAQDYLT